VSAIEVIRALNDGHVTTRHPLEVVIWTNEEGPHFGISALGSGVAAGVLGPEILDRKDEEGLTLADWLRRYGQDPAHLTEARILRGTLAAILELHIEQGPQLYEAKVQIGVVQGIVGLKRWKCVAMGFANHAGTTPMNRRKDALAAAAKDLLAVRDVVRAEPGRQVGPVGYMKAEPGAPNVIDLGRCRQRHRNPLSVNPETRQTDERTPMRVGTFQPFGGSHLLLDFYQDCFHII
jgi:N-carbamoyl-L-amino-acid hydrolase